MDLTKGYYQFAMHPDLIEKTAFVVPHSKYEITVMTFGFSGAPSVFQQLMNKRLEGLTRFSSAYFDDISIFSMNVEDHLNHVEEVLSRLRKHGLVVKPAKCQMFRETVVCLGHQVGGGNVKLLKAKIITLQQYPKPRTKKNIRAFLGMVNYYRKFILQL